MFGDAPVIRNNPVPTKIAVEPLVRNRIDDVLVFLKAQYGDNYYGANRTFFEWQYLKPPCSWFSPSADKGLLPVNAVLSEEGDLLAVHAFIPFDAKTPWGGSKGIWDEEWINGSTVPGLGRSMVDFLMQTVDLYIGFGCNELSENAFKKIGLSFVPEVSREVIVLAPELLTDTMATHGLFSKSIQAFDLECSNKGYQLISSAADIPHSLLDAREHEMVAGPVRNQKWLAWRYDNHPFIAYRAVTSLSGADQGTAVVRVETIRNTGLNVCRLVDLYFAPGHETDLVLAIVSFAQAHDCVLLDYFTTSTQSSARLVQAGRTGGLSVLSNPDIPYMFQPLTVGARTSFNAVFAANCSSPTDLALTDILATKADSTQDIERNPPTTGTQTTGPG